MLYRKSITPAFIGIALILTFSTASASELDKSAKDQEIIVAHSSQYQGHTSAHTKNFKEKGPIEIVFLSIKAFDW